VKRWLKVLLVSSLATAACGGGGDGGTIGSDIAASFVPDQPSPGAATVNMTWDSSIGDTATLQVRVTNTDDVYGAAFDVVYDPSRVTFVTWAPGALLESGGHVPNYAVNSPEPGRVVVGASRKGNVSGVDVVGSRVLIRLVFRVTEVGSSAVAFQAASLIDAALPPQDISGTTWFGGALVGS
jgi:hypothetical protein